MQDGVPKGEGNSRLLKSAAGLIPESYAAFRDLLTGAGVPIDFLINELGWNALGTLLNKANLLTDATATKLGMALAAATPNEALMALDSRWRIGDVLFTTVNPDARWLLANGAPFNGVNYPELAAVRPAEMLGPWRSVTLAVGASDVLDSNTYQIGGYFFVFPRGPAGTGGSVTGAVSTNLTSWSYPNILGSTSANGLVQADGADDNSIQAALYDNYRTSSTGIWYWYLPYATSPAGPWSVATVTSGTPSNTGSAGASGLVFFKNKWLIGAGRAVGSGMTPMGYAWYCPNKTPSSGWASLGTSVFGPFVKSDQYVLGMNNYPGYSATNLMAATDVQGPWSSMASPWGSMPSLLPYVSWQKSEDFPNGVWTYYNNGNLYYNANANPLTTWTLVSRASGNTKGIRYFGGYWIIGHTSAGRIWYSKSLLSGWQQSGALLGVAPEFIGRESSGAFTYLSAGKGSLIVGADTNRTDKLRVLCDTAMFSLPAVGSVDDAYAYIFARRAI